MTHTDAPNPDAIAAHTYYTEIMTRIATQRLHFSEGDEKAALSSLLTLFDLARKTINANYGCDRFSQLTLDFLNGEFRGFMADWHRKDLNGELATRDGAVEFRTQLRALQDQFRTYAGKLHVMAYGTPIADFPDDIVPPPLHSAPLKFGIPKDGLILSQADVDRINTSEAAAITKRRSHNGTTVSAGIDNAAALALSGGGIRSASFCLGIAQVFAQQAQIMKSFDLMSTVSGGGFTGSFLVRRMETGGPEAVASPDGPDPEAIKYLRQRADYLATGSFWITLGIAVNLLAGMIINWTAPAAVIALLVCAALLTDAGQWVPMFATPMNAAILFGAALLAYVWVPYETGKLRINLLWGLFGAAAAVFGLWVIALGYSVFDGRFSQSRAGLTVSVGALAAALPALSRLLPMLGSPWVRIIGNRIAVTIATIAVPLLALYLGYVLYHLGLSSGGAFPGWAIVALITALLVATALFTIDINVTGPHWLYRQQLGNTFIRRTQDDDIDVPLSSIDPDQNAPYLLMNAVVNLPNSTRVDMRERRGDFFLFSKHWCGSPLTGYRPTKTWLRWRTREIDLATAIATSGAAVAPHMALMSMSSARALLSLLNIRLGFWVKRPALNASEPSGTGGRPGARMLLREMFAARMNETEDWMMLTDGAHLENSAIYELLRRRCKYIVAVDGSEEVDGAFNTILTLVRHASLDFGIRINCDLNEMRPAADTGLSRAHAVLCEIHYPAVGDEPAATGLLLIFKLSMTGNESELINAYKHANPQFPHQSTADQFFDEHQFEAFRALGVHAAESLLKPALIGAGDVADVGNWLERLRDTIPPKADK